MSISERQRQFKAAVEEWARDYGEPQIAENFGFSNSARLIEGGMFVCTSNLQGYSEEIASDPTARRRQFIFLTALTFPPHDEVYFAVVVRAGAETISNGLMQLRDEVLRRNEAIRARGGKESRINNNVKFFLTSGAQMYFDNDFVQELSPSELTQKRLAAVDSVLFAIHPPAVSARRSLIAREFVGFLGTSVGTERVHELRVWEDETSVGPEMRRMPDTVDLAEIKAGITHLGGFYADSIVERFHAGLNHLPAKHFVILPGISGTGKSLLGELYARTVHGLRSRHARDPLLFMCRVRPEWTDPTGLTGYHDLLSGKYIVPPFLEALLVAIAHKNSPIFVILDEMNLARVEYYFADVLSCMESGGTLQLHSSGVPIEASTGGEVPAAIEMPPNLFLIGTINIDETTNALSDKVVDRTTLIDMSAVDLKGYLAELLHSDVRMQPSISVCEPILIGVHDALAVNGVGFGYRLAREFVHYHHFAVGRLGRPSDEVIDEQLVQKALVKLRGTERQRGMLTALTKLVDQYPRASALLARLQSDLDELGSFQNAR